jgi:hypothetical protein
MAIEGRLFLPVEDILLDTKNPRYRPRENQREILQATITSQGDKLLELAEDIAQHGLLLTETPIALRHSDGAYIMVEGNRRLAAIKLASSPELLNSMEIPPKDLMRYKALRDRPNLPRSIECLVITDYEDARHAMEVKHGQKQGGRAILRWNGIQQQRFLGIRSLELDAVELVADGSYLSDEVRDITEQNYSTLKRILENPVGLKLLGFTRASNRLIMPEDGGLALKRLSLVVTEIATGIVKVSKVRTPEQIETYVKTVVDRVSNIDEQRTAPSGEAPSTESTESKHPDGDDGNGSQPGSGNGSKSAAGANGDESKSGDHDGSAPATGSPSSDDTPSDDKENNRKTRPSQRKTLIPADDSFNIPTPYTRIKRIFEELQWLDATKYPNCCAITFRTFLEMSLEAYGQEHGISFYETIERAKKDGSVVQQVNELSFDRKLSKVIEYLEKTKKVHKNDLQGAKRMREDQSNVLSVVSLHGYVHNADYNPIVRELILEWDNVRPFIAHLWPEGQKFRATQSK